MSMGGDVDKSLLDRLKALRGGSAASQASRASQEIKIDVIERAKTPTREDALAARLKSLREGSATPEAKSLARPSLKPTPQSTPASSEKTTVPNSKAAPGTELTEEGMEEIFETDDDTLQELLADVAADEEVAVSGMPGPSDDEVKALLERLADDIPKDTASPSTGHSRDDGIQENDSDDSDGEVMGREIDEVVERYKDEAALDASNESKEDEEDKYQEPHDEATRDDAEQTDTAADLGLPDVPSDLQDLPFVSNLGKQTTPELDDITARMAALRAPSHNTDGGGDDDDGTLSLPSVPTSRPSGKPIKRLETTTKYTDDDVGSWCTVCLDDAMLRCLGCDNDVYCMRCWREMHVGPAAAFDDRSHRAVQFTRDKKKKEAPRKIALGS